jgi:tetratricopeptide (TPR) repeat protein
MDQGFLIGVRSNNSHHDQGCTMAAPSKADLLCEQGKALLKERKIDEAFAMFEQAIQENSKHVAAHESLAAIYFARKDYEKAAANFQKASQYDPRRVDPMINLGAVQNRMGDYQAAVKTLQKAVSRDRRNAAAYYNLAIAQKGLNQPHLAVSAYKEALKLDPKMVEAIQNLGNLYLEMVNVQQAEFQYHKALDINPNFERAKRGIERSRLMAEEKRKAINPFGRLVNMEELDKRADQKVRKLSPQEQYEDRTEVHRIAKESEHAALVLLNTLRDRIGPVISRINHSFSQSEDPRMLSREVDIFAAELVAFERANGELKSRIEELREHETAVRQ